MEADAIYTPPARVKQNRADTASDVMRGGQDDPPIDCCVRVGFFLPSFGREWMRMPYAPPCWNQTKSSGRLIAKDAARGFDASDRVGEGGGQQYEPPIDCCVWVGLFPPHYARSMKNYVIRPPLLELNRFEQAPRRPGCGARVRRAGQGGGGAWPAGWPSD